MKDYKFDENGENLSDEYLSDQSKSNQYAEAARLANKQSQAKTGPSSDYRKVQFEKKVYSDQANQDVLQREQAFSESLDKTNYQNTNFDQEPDHQFNLEDLDDLSDDTPRVRHKGRTTRYKGRRDDQSSGRHSKKAGNKHFKDILAGLKQSIFLLFSKRPMQAFHLNLNWGSIGILAFINILLVASFNSLIYSKTVDNILPNLASEGGTGRIFGISLLSQLSTLILLTVLVLLLSLLLRSEKKPFKQFVQTPVLSITPYSIMLLVALLTAFFLPQIALLIAFAGKIHTYIYLYAGFQKGHPTKKNSPFWIFVLLIFLVVLVQYLFVGWALSLSA